MESDDLKPNHPSDDASLDAWLRSQAALGPMPDADFSRRVLAALPPPPRRSGHSGRLLVILLGIAAGTGLAVFKLLAAAPVAFSVLPGAPEMADALVKLSDPQLYAALGLTSLALAFAFWPDLQRSLWH